MFEIRREQIAVLAEPFRARFRAELARFIRTNLPESAGDDDEIAALVEHAIARAAPYGIHACRDVARYLGFMAVLGRDFDDDPGHRWARAILEDPDASGAEKLHRMLHGLGVATSPPRS